MRVKAKKHLGQHFLNDEAIAKKIVDSLSWLDYAHAIEIGPGMGVLTKYLIEKNKKLSLIELDSESVDYLNKIFDGENIEVYERDFLKLDWLEFNSEPFAVVGNFPYNISSQILFKILENKSNIPEVVGMFQKEVAERVSAKEGSKIYGILSVLVQAYYKVEYLFSVPENVFTPPPKVKSGVIKLSKYRNTLAVDEKLFFSVVKTAFNQRRKKLRNALSSIIPAENLTEEIFNQRAEQLNVTEFIELTQLLKNKKTSE